MGFFARLLRRPPEREAEREMEAAQRATADEAGRQAEAATILRPEVAAQRVELLARVPLFAGMGDQELEAVSSAVEELDVPAGTALTHEGRHEGYFFVIVSGTVRIERSGRTVNTIGSGDFLGEIALLDGGPRTATAITETPCRLLSLEHPSFHKLLDSSPTVRTAVLEAVGGRLREMDADPLI